MAAIDAPTIILPAGAEPIVDRDLTTYNEERDGGTGIGMAVCTGEVIRRLREEGGVMDAMTPGLFMMVEGDKEYNTFLEMLRDQPKMPDPIFKSGEVEWTVEDVGCPLDRMDEIDAEFKKLYEEMFNRTHELGTMGAGEFELRLNRRQNELSESKTENPNGGGVVLISTGGSSVHMSEHPPSSVHNLLQVLSPGTLLPPPEEGGYARTSEVDDGRSGSPVDA